MDLFLVVLLFVALFGLLLMGYPVAFTLGGVALAFGLFHDPRVFGDLSTNYFGVMKNEILMAVPLFIFMGMILEKSKLAEELLETMGFLFGRMRGGLAISVVVVGALLAASTGIVGATVVTMGLLSLPTMLKRGYRAELATGTICASGTLGQIIPPSIVLVLLGSVMQTGQANSQVDVGGLFKGAVVPGILLVVLYVAWIGVVAAFRPAAAPAMPEEEVRTFRKNAFRRILFAFLPPLLLMVLVLGTIFAGVASPTEAAAVGALGATVLAILRRKFNRKMLQESMAETTKISCMVFLILMGARAFSLVFIDMDGNVLLADLIRNAELGPRGFLLLVMVVIFVAGFFIDFIEITFIIVPIVVAVIAQTGMEINLLWLGILIALNLQTSFLTPPFGFSLFYLKGVAPPGVTTGQIYRGIVPFIAIQLICIALVLLLPDTALWLPRATAGVPATP